MFLLLNATLEPHTSLYRLHYTIVIPHSALQLFTKQFCTRADYCNVFTVRTQYLIFFRVNDGIHRSRAGFLYAYNHKDVLFRFFLQ
jgi:hypothetical protein